MQRAIVAMTAAACILLGSVGAAGNGRFPAANQLAFSPVDPDTVVLRTTFGILVTHDAGKTWRWLCEDVLGLPSTSNEDPSIAMTASGTLVAGTSLGLRVSSDAGCNWVAGALQSQPIRDLAVRPDNPHALVVLVSSYAAPSGPDASAGSVTQVFASTDDGLTFAQTGAPIDPSVVVTTIDVAASDPQRLYVAGYRPVGSTHVPVLFVSTDMAGHWTERPMPALRNEVAVFIAAVDPAHADWVYLRTEGQSRLFVTMDAGVSFTIPLTFSGQMLGFALSPDGSKIFAGGPLDGVQMARQSSLALQGAFHKTSTIHAQCLAAQASALWACSDEASGFIAGSSPDDGTTFEAKLHLSGIAAPLACPAGATASRCNALFDALCANLGGCADAGDQATTDASTGFDASEEAATGGRTPPTPRGSCACEAVGKPSAVGGWWALLAGAFVARGRTRRRRSR